MSALPERIDEQGKPYKCTSDDSAYAIFKLKDGTVCQFNSSWVTRVRRDDLLDQADAVGLRGVEHEVHQQRVALGLGVAEPAKLQNCAGYFVEDEVESPPRLDEVGVFGDGRFEQFTLTPIGRRG